MKAIVFRQYGSPDFMALTEVAKPVPNDNEVLVKVAAVSVNEWDWAVLHGTPFINRFETGLIRPNKQILGVDVAGRVVEVGKSVEKLRVGDEVFGDICFDGSDRFPKYRGGGFSEYVCAHEGALRQKGDSLTFEQAAALPQAGALAVQGLLKGKVPLESSFLEKTEKTLKVLINGASGGVGTLAVQLAKAVGAEVTGVCRTSKMEWVQSLGADNVIDYTKEDFTRCNQRYDVILDVMAFHSVFDYKRVLKPNGRYVMLGGGTIAINQVMFLGPLISLIGSKKMGLLFYKPNMGLDVLMELINLGKVIPVIHRTFCLSETPDAFRYYGEGHTRGKIVITVD